MKISAHSTEQSRIIQYIRVQQFREREERGDLDSVYKPTAPVTPFLLKILKFLTPLSVYAEI